MDDIPDSNSDVGTGSFNGDSDIPIPSSLHGHEGYHDDQSAISDSDDNSRGRPSTQSDTDSEISFVDQGIFNVEQQGQKFAEKYYGNTTGESARRRHHRKPKKSVQSVEAKLRLNQASAAFLSEEYTKALSLVKDALRLDGQAPNAWALMSSIFEEQGEHEQSVMALLFSAQLRPKDTECWLSCAENALQWLGDQEMKALAIAHHCYRAALRADPNHTLARLGKASVAHGVGHVAKAIADYSLVLESDPENEVATRGLAEACLDDDGNRELVELAKESYHQFVTRCLAEGDQGRNSLTWSDILVYSELSSSLGLHTQAISDLKSLSRWYQSRVDDTTWDTYIDDDREWDLGDERRLLVADFDANAYPLEAYYLPLEARIRLMVYRLRLGDEEETKYQLSRVQKIEGLEDQLKESARDLADLFFECGDLENACTYYQKHQSTNETADDRLLVRLGTCYLQMSRDSEAEECFLAAIEADPETVEARVELAKVYEKAHEDGEAYILIAEAMRLAESQARRTQAEEDSAQRAKTRKYQSVVAGGARRPYRRRAGDGRPRQRRSPAGFASRYRPRRLVSVEQRKEEESMRTKKLKEQYKFVQDLRDKAKDSSSSSFPAWMEAAKTLIDDFRSFKEFYHWEKYLRFLRRSVGGGSGGPSKEEIAAVNPMLADMAERLTKHLAPTDSGEGAPKQPHRDNYLGIPFKDWLDLFLEYALKLARSGRSQEAYQVCESARDSIIFMQSHEDLFLIHTVWGSCAVQAKDEQTCVAVARFFMRNYQLSADSSRLFAALVRVCKAPSYWYSSGPTQKYILRQIRLVDQTLMAERARSRGAVLSPEMKELTVSLNMLYGNILFSSMSYTFALNYFLRAHSVAPDNPTICFSIALGYIHYALKRQSYNRQYLIMQGLTFLHKYRDLRCGGDSDGNGNGGGPGPGGGGGRGRLGQGDSGSDNATVGKRRHWRGEVEANYNMGRAYQMLGIIHIAIKHYGIVLELAEEIGLGGDRTVGGKARVKRLKERVRKEAVARGGGDEGDGQGREKRRRVEGGDGGEGVAQGGEKAGTGGDKDHGAAKKDHTAVTKDREGKKDGEGKKAGVVDEDEEGEDGEEWRNTGPMHSFVSKTAFNLRLAYMASGDMASAWKITQAWLIL